MKIANLPVYICPKTGSPLQQKGSSSKGEIVDGELVNARGDIYQVQGGIVHFVTNEDLVGNASFARNYYAGIADTYDANVDITFKLYNEEESVVRNKLVDLLELKPNYQVLEVSTGTGKDSEIIVNRLNGMGQLFCLDISPDMLRHAQQRLAKFNESVELVCASAVSLPFASRSFDALFCFAGVGHFPDVRSALKEMARVVKVGGKVVFCEKNVPPWLKDTTYGKVCINNNPMFAEEVPLQHVPVEARDVCLRWLNGNVHYVVDYRVGEGEPRGNFDLELPGARGGTFNTRYFGKLEGVTAETKEKAIKAQQKLGVSMHKWLDALIRSEAERVLGAEKVIEEKK